MTTPAQPLPQLPALEADNEEAAAYCHEVARFFLALKGTGFFLSSLDAELILSWYDAGFPLATVLRGLHRGAVKKQLEGIRTVRRLKRYVTLEARKLGPRTDRRASPSNLPPPSDAALERLLKLHRERLLVVKQTALEGGLPATAALADEVLQALPEQCRGASWDAGGPIATFLRLGRMFYDRLLPLLPASDAQALRGRARASLRGLETQMSTEALEETVAELTLSYLREQVGLFEPGPLYSLWEEQ